MSVKVKKHKGEYWVFVDDESCGRTASGRLKRPSKRIGSKEAAEIVKKEVERLLALGQFLGFGAKARGDRGELFEPYALRWLEDGKVERKYHSHRFYKTNLMNHVIPILKDRPIGEIDRSDARTVAQTLRRKGCSIHVVTAALSSASTLMTQAFEDKLVPGNPFFRMSKHKKSADELINDEPARAMTSEEAKAMLAAARATPEYYAFYMTALRTGMRLGELLGLEWDAIDFDKLIIKVRKAWTGSRWTTTKKRRRREVEMTKQLAEALQAHRVLMQARALALGKPMPSRVFVDWGQDAVHAEVVKLSWWKRRGNGRQGPKLNGGKKRTFGQVIDGDWFSKQVHAKLLKRVGLDVTIHELRHTYASLMIFKVAAKGKDGLAYVSRQMGHSSIQVTVDIYGHFVPEVGARAVDCLDDEDFQPGEVGRAADSPSAGAR